MNSGIDILNLNWNDYNYLLVPAADRMAAPHLLFHSRDMMIVVLANHLYWLYIELKFEFVLNFI